MKHKTASLILITALFAPVFAFSENKQKVEINGAVVEVRDGAVANIEVKNQTVPFLGVYAVPIHPIVAKQLNLPSGLYLSVEQAIPDSPAAKAGLERFDVLMKFDDQILVNSQQLQALVRSKKKGDRVQLSVLRGGKEKTVEVELGEQKVPDALVRQVLPIPVPANPAFDFGLDFPFGLDAQAFGFDDLELGDAIRDQIQQQIQRQMQQLGQGGLGREPNDPALLQKYDADGDGKLSQIEQDNAREDGALPQRKRGVNRMEEMRDRIQALRERQLNRPFQQFGRAAPDLQDPELLEKYDVDGDGKLSRIERDKARDEGAIPEQNLDLGFNFGLGIPRADDLLRDARRRGAANAWSSVSGSAQTRIVTMDETGSYEFSSNDGKKSFKATSRDGKVLFDGPVNTEEERLKLPEALRQRLDSIESNVKIHVRPKPDRDVQPQKQNKKGKAKKNQLL